MKNDTNLEHKMYGVADDMTIFPLQAFLFSLPGSTFQVFRILYYYVCR